MMWFQSKNDDGIVFHEYFTPIPIQAIALALTMVKIEALLYRNLILTSVIRYY